MSNNVALYLQMLQFHKVLVFHKFWLQMTTWLVNIARENFQSAVSRNTHNVPCVNKFWSWEKGPVMPKFGLQQKKRSMYTYISTIKVSF